MVEGDLFREVDEDLRRERMAKMWDAYGVHVLVAAALIVASVAGYKAWQWWTDKQAAENGAIFVKALALADDGKPAEMTAALMKISKDGPRGYALLAKLHLAAQFLSEGKTAEAGAQYDAIASDGYASELIRGFARVQSAAMVVDKSDMAEMRKRLQDLDTPASPWRASARELIGLAAYKDGKFDEAEEMFQLLAADSKTPAQMKKRAETLLALLVKPVPESSGKAKEPARDEAKTQ
jgi:hypothetical protein